MLDRILDLLSVTVDKILHSRLLNKILGLRVPPQRESFGQFMAKAYKELMEQEKTKRDLTPDEEAGFKAAKRVLQMDDAERVTGGARRMKEQLEEEKARGALGFHDRATLKLVTKFLDEKNERKKVKLLKELLRRDY